MWALSVAHAGWGARLRVASTALLAPWRELVDEADPRGLVLPRSRALCAALGELAGVTFDALAARRDPLVRAQVTRAAAGLSLLTKVDDQHIDAREFHGVGSREALRERTRAYLAPTLASLREVRPAVREARCALAARVGQAISALAADDARRASVVELVERGWETQVDAVAVLTSPPGAVSASDVEDVTARISGLWLAMVCAIGGLPRGALRGLSTREVEAFLAWGRWVQRADALADLGRDLGDGLVSTAVGHRLWTLDPDGYTRALEGGDAEYAYARVKEHGLDRALRPDVRTRRALDASLASLGELPSLLGWILGYLLGRYDARAPGE